MITNAIGKSVSRVDGKAKVTGEAKYAADFHRSDLTYGYVLSSDIAKGRITNIDTSEALRLQGVIQVFTHENRPGTAWFDRNYRDEDSPPGSPFRPLYDEEIYFSQQPIALVVADTFELARYAASLVRVEYDRDPHETDLGKQREHAYAPKKYKAQPPPKQRGNPADAYAHADIQLEAEYTHPSEHHNPIEMHASTVVWEENGTLTIYDKTQGVVNTKNYVTKVFSLSRDEVHVLSPFVGGAFGSGLRPQYQLFLAVMAALELRRSVSVVLTRQQMFSFGHRPATLQRFWFGASSDGKLEALIQETVAETSRFEDYSENVTTWANVLYHCDNASFTHKLVQLDVYTPIDMRAPGGATGMYALECAMDELAYKLGMDPIELRLKNYTKKDQNKDAPFSSKELRACYRQGAEKFGWDRRNPTPRSMREGKQLIGWGMATGAWEAVQQQASAKAFLSTDGRLTVSSATADIGTGTYTIMTQIAAETLGLPLEDVTFKLGDSSHPEAPLEGGSKTASSVGSAVKAACDGIREKLFKMAQKIDDSPFATVQLEEIVFDNGKIRLHNDPSVAIAITEVMRKGKVNFVENVVAAKPDTKQKKFARYTHSAVFVEVKVDEDFGTVKVSRVVSATAGGRIINPKTARSQILGGVVWGIGMALEEESVPDHNYGRFMNHNLAEYHVPVHADVHDIEVIFIEEKDDIVNPLGAKGLGEIGIVGVAAAISNAIYHATGKRVRDLPITLDKISYAS